MDVQGLRTNDWNTQGLDAARIQFQFCASFQPWTLRETTCSVSNLDFLGNTHTWSLCTWVVGPVRLQHQPAEDNLSKAVFFPALGGHENCSNVRPLAQSCILFFGNHGSPNGLRSMRWSRLCCSLFPMFLPQHWASHASNHNHPHAAEGLS